MALYWTIDSRSRLVNVLADGAVTREDVVRLLDVLDTGEHHRFRKLVNGLAAEVVLTAEEALQLAARVRERHAAMPPGPLALVVRVEMFETFRTVFGTLAAADRPFRLFDDLAKATRWIESPAVRDWRPPQPGLTPRSLSAAAVVHARRGR